MNSYIELLKDPRYRNLSYEDKLRVERGEISLDNVEFVPFEGVEQAYAQTQAPPPIPEPSFLDKAGAVAGSFGQYAIGGAAKGIGDVARTVSDSPVFNLITDPTGYLASSVDMAPEQFARGETPKGYAGRGFEQFGQEFADTSRFQEAQDILTQQGIAPDSVAGMVSQTGASVFPMGLAMLTRNPSAGAAVMGGATLSSEYVEGLDRGYSPNKAFQRAIPMAAAEAAAERLGLGAFFKGGLKPLGELADKLEKRYVGRLAGVAGINVAEELATNEVQMAIDEDVYGVQLTPEEKSLRRMQAGVGGLTMGAGLGSITALQAPTPITEQGFLAADEIAKELGLEGPEQVDRMSRRELVEADSRARARKNERIDFENLLKGQIDNEVKREQQKRIQQDLLQMEEDALPVEKAPRLEDDVVDFDEALRQAQERVAKRAEREALLRQEQIPIDLKERTEPLSRPSIDRMKMEEDARVAAEERKAQEDFLWEQQQQNKRQQVLEKEVDDAYKSGDDIRIAKAEQALNSFYKEPAPTLRTVERREVVLPQQETVAPTTAPPTEPVLSKEEARVKEIDSQIIELQSRQKRARTDAGRNTLQSQIDNLNTERNDLESIIREPPLFRDLPVPQPNVPTTGTITPEMGTTPRAFDRNDVYAPEVSAIQDIQTPTTTRTFTTSKGSVYTVFDDGTTERDKAARTDPGHEGDSGKKARTLKTIYIDPSVANAGALSSAGLSDKPESRVIIKDGKVSLLTWNKKENRWGIAPSSRDIPFSTTPSVGLQPLELCDKKDDISGYEAFSRMHAGNKIVSVEQSSPLTAKKEQQPAPTQPTEARKPAFRTEAELEQDLLKPASPEEVAALRAEIGWSPEPVEIPQQQRPRAEESITRVRDALASRKLGDGIDVVYEPPEPTAKTVRAGYFNPKTGRVVLNAAVLEDADDVAAVSVHEIAHALNQSQTQAQQQGAKRPTSSRGTRVVGGVSRRSLQSLLGEANQQSVNNRIKALAVQFKPLSAAVERANKSNSPDQELLSYALEELSQDRARNPQKGVSPRIKSLLRDVSFYIREKLTQYGFGSVGKEFDVEDLYRLGRLMEREFTNRPQSRPTPMEKGEVLESTQGTEKPGILESRRAAQPKDVEKVVRPTDGTPSNVIQEPVSRLGETLLSDANISPENMLQALLEMGKGKLSEASVKAIQSIRNIERAVNKIPRAKRPEARRLLVAVDVANDNMNNAMDSDINMRKVVDRLLGSKDFDKAKAQLTRQREKDAVAKYESLQRDIDKAMNALKEKAPRVHEAYSESRRKVRTFSYEIIQEIINSGRQLTNADLGRIKKIRRQLNTYVTRQYKALSPDWRASSSYIDSVLNAYDRFLKKGEKSDLASAMADAMDYLKKNTLDIGSFIELAKKQGNYVSDDGTISLDPTEVRGMPLDEFQQLARRWIDDGIGSYPLSAMTDEQRDEYFDKTVDLLLKEKANLERQGKYQEVLNKKAEDLAKEILGAFKSQDNISAFAKGMRGIANNPGILKQKQNVPPEIRKLLGEVEDPLSKLQATLAMQASYLAKADSNVRIYEYLRANKLAMQESEIGKGGFDETKLTATIPDNPDSYGPLANLRTTDEIASILKGVESVRVPSVLEAVDAVRRGDAEKKKWLMENPFLFLGDKVKKDLRFVQKVKVVYNTPLSVFSNAVGAAISTPLQNGHVFNPNTDAHKRSMTKALNAALGTFVPGRRTEMNRFAAEMLRQGLTDSAEAYEMQKDIQSNRARRLLAETATKERHGLVTDYVSKVLEALRASGEVVDESLVWAVATSDRMFVYYAYFMEKEFLTEYYNALGKKVKEQDLEIEAAERIKQSNINPARVPRWVSVLQETGLTTYARFFYETFRSIKGAIQLGLKDVAEGKKLLSNPKTRKAGRLKIQRGAARTTGAVGSLIANRVIIQASIRGGAYFGLAAGFAALLSGGGGGEDEEAKTEDGWARIQSLADRDRSWLDVGVDSEGGRYYVDLGRFEVFETSAAPLISLLLQAAPEKAAEQMLDLIIENPIARATWDTLAKESVTAEDGLKKALKAHLPRIVIENIGMGMQRPEGVAIPATANALSRLGLYVQRYNPKDSFAFVWRDDIQQAIEKNRQDLKDLVTDEDFDEQAFKSKIADIATIESKLWDRAQEMISGARLIGTPDEQIAESLKNQRVSNDTKDSLINDEYQSLILNLRSFDSTKKGVLEKPDFEAKEKIISQNFDKARLILEEFLSNQKATEGY